MKRKKQLLVYDSDPVYGRRLAEYLGRQDNFPYAVREYTTLEGLKQAIRQEKADVVCMPAEQFDAQVKEYQVPYVLLLSDKSEVIGEGIEVVDRYQSGEILVRKLIALDGTSCYEEELQLQSQQAEWIGVYSPVKRCLQTTFALTLGQALAARHRTLYLNFESVSGFDYWMNRELGQGMMDLAFCFDGSREKFLYHFRNMVQTVNGLDYIVPALDFCDLATVSGTKWCDMLRVIAEQCGYRYIVLDLSECIQGMTDILDHCSRVFTLSQEDGLAAAKLHQYETVLRLQEKERVLERTYRPGLPDFRRLPRNLEEVPFGEMAGYVRNMIREQFADEV